MPQNMMGLSQLLGAGNFPPGPPSGMNMELTSILGGTEPELSPISGQPMDLDQAQETAPMVRGALGILPRPRNRRSARGEVV